MGTRRIKKRTEQRGILRRWRDAQIEELDSAMIEALVKSGAPHELIYAYLKTDRLVTRENMQFLSDKELQEWNEAIDEYRTDERIQTSLATTIQSCEKAEQSSAWRHFMCVLCWQKLGFPKEDAGEQVHQRCCYCGHMSQSGFNLCEDPETTPCHGKHEQ